MLLKTFDLPNVIRIVLIDIPRDKFESQVDPIALFKTEFTIL